MTLKLDIAKTKESLVINKTKLRLRAWGEWTSRQRDDGDDDFPIGYPSVSTIQRFREHGIGVESRTLRKGMSPEAVQEALKDMYCRQTYKRGGGKLLSADYEDENRVQDAVNAVEELDNQAFRALWIKYAEYQKYETFEEQLSAFGMGETAYKTHLKTGVKMVATYLYKDLQTGA